MFTGIIAAQGTVIDSTQLGEGKRYQFEIKGSNDHPPLIQGESVSINGVCSTILPDSEHCFFVDYLPETLKKTNLGELKPNDTVNLEWALRLSDRLGGHLLSGHVDCTGQVIDIIDQDPFSEWIFSMDSQWGRYLVPKGCISIDGISLTVVDVKKDQFSCHIIPHTRSQTNLNGKQISDTVNLEFDLMAKYCQKYLEETPR